MPVSGPKIGCIYPCKYHHDDDDDDDDDERPYQFNGCVLEVLIRCKSI